MRLDHLLSKEKMAVEETAGLLRSGRSQARKRFALFNLEGTRVKKTCRGHVFSVYRGSYADAAAPEKGVPSLHIEN